VGGLEAKLTEAKAQLLPAGPTAWPISDEPELNDDLADGGSRDSQTTTSGEEG
jgi:hypothetical protein